MLEVLDMEIWKASLLLSQQVPDEQWILNQPVNTKMEKDFESWQAFNKNK